MNDIVLDKVDNSISTENFPLDSQVGNDKGVDTNFELTKTRNDFDVSFCMPKNFKRSTVFSDVSYY